ncbi:MAG: AAA family ATPase, partial [Candidatus ainarchaeum sp.]|nr:AAA family ATPase [Candidatus ainarchaeum sp.]
KTLLAKAVANEAQVHFISVSAPEVMGKFVGEAEGRVRQIFKDAEENAPSIIFIDEIDAIASKRDEAVGEVERRVVAQLLSLMDGLSSRGEVIVMAATNRVNSIDEALRRPGRFDREIEFGIPDKKSRKQILGIHTRGMPLAKTYYFVKNIDVKKENNPIYLKIFDIVKENNGIDIVEILDQYNKKFNEKKRASYFIEIIREMVEKKILKKEEFDLTYFADLTHGFVGADLQALTKEAAMKALRRYLPEIEKIEESQPIPVEILESLKITKKDFFEGLKDVQPSALREISIEVPNVKWDQIGALDEIKEELKQTIEWPLKNPIAFQEMGISPPKGILLYGPPGTGKTLLAKAIATESEANFISIKGPELLSMWSGESLPYDEEILVFDGQKIFLEKIGLIVEEKKDWSVVTFDNDGKTFFGKINGHIKHKLNGKLLEVVTKTGRRIKVTDKHSLFSLVENEIEEVTPNQLVSDKSVIAIPAKIPNISLGDGKLNLLNLLKDKDVFVHSNQISEMLKEIGYLESSKLLNISKKYVYDIVEKNLPISIKNFYKLKAHSKIKLDLNKIFVSKKNSISRLPAIFEITVDLFELIGLWVAEGDFNSGVLRLSIQNKNILEKTIIILEKLNLPFSIIKNKGIVINSATLRLVFESFGLESGAFVKNIPNNLLTEKTSIVNSFLRGYFSGDGTISTNGRAFYVEATTVSKRLANNLMFLLLKIGIVSSIKKKEERTGSISYRIRIYGTENLQKFSFAGFIDCKRQSLLEEASHKHSWNRSNTIPINPKISALLNEAFVSYPKNNSVGKNKLKEALCLVDVQKQKFLNLWKLVDADIYWDVVKEINVIENQDFVYDISVEPGQNFVSGFGGIFAHNSEKGVRKIFRRARQVAPCIIFFDEIDSIASRRGRDVGSNVTERMVNQLLTELDGVESLKDVIFIAATNRPDLIDPALLRPGRIDKLVRVPAPDEKAREKILEVHTKKVKLAKNVSIKNIASKTNGFSGADLEGLVRESALLVLKENNMKPNEIEMRHFEQIIKKMNPTIDSESEKAYDEFKEKALDFRPNYVG